MDKRTISKYAAKIVVSTTVGAAITKAILANAPSTSNFHVAEMTGAVGGWIAGEKLEPITDEIVDALWNRYEAKKASKK